NNTQSNTPQSMHSEDMRMDRLTLTESQQGRLGLTPSPGPGHSNYASSSQTHLAQQQQQQQDPRFRSSPSHSPAPPHRKPVPSPGINTQGTTYQPYQPSASPSVTSPPGSAHSGGSGYPPPRGPPIRGDSTISVSSTHS